MVKVREQEDNERLDGIVRAVCEQHSLILYVEGWARKTFDVFLAEDRQGREKELIARVESLVTTSGQIYYFDDKALAFCQDLGEALEKEFDFGEAELVKRPLPHY